MSLFNVLSLIGGLALFLFGMNIMGDALEKQSGSKFNRVLERLTSNPLKGVALGAAVTAVIQSSSATTVMVVGFVNSGIMQLSQAVGIIMGANIGTTITSWLLSLTGISSDNLFINMLKPSSFAPVLAMIGIILYMFLKNGKFKQIGLILLGFTVLMTGMDTMSSAVKPLADVPEFANILTLFSNPILGVIAGALMTAVVQSSSASVGILQALSVTGSITYGAAIPIIMGQNIGTCVTAMISSIGANKNAKRAALIHLYFNIIGTAFFLALFCILNAVLQFSFVEQSIGIAGVAVVHSLFNIACTVLLFPFSKLLVKLACISIKDSPSEEDKQFQLLDERFLQTPSFAVEQCKELTDTMAGIVRDSMITAMDLLDKYDETKAQQVTEDESRVDIYEDKLGTYLVKLSRESLSVKDSHQVSKLLHSIGDFERISDHAVNLLKVADEIHQKRIRFSPDAVHELSIMSNAVIEILSLATDSFVSGDLESAAKVEPLEQVIDYLKAKLKARHIDRLQRGECTTEMGFIFSDIITNYERIADHCSNIAVCIIQINEDSFDTHEYLNTLKNSDNSDFSQMYNGFKAKYAL